MKNFSQENKSQIVLKKIEKDVKNAIVGKYLPLVGPPTSHSWLYFGPLYYWLMVPVLMIGNYNPILSLYLGILLGVLIVIVNYLI